MIGRLRAPDVAAYSSLLKHLRNSSLYDGGSALAIHARQRSRDSEADPQPHLYEFRSTQAARTRDPHAL